MDTDALAMTWPLQRLFYMINFVQTRNNESWKESPLLSPSSPEKTEVGTDDRNEAVEWIAKVNRKFHFHHETFFLATNILDRFINSVKAQTKHLKCIAISCLYLASKVNEEEDVIPCTGELVKESDCGCRVCDVLRMERIIVDKLSWFLNSSTALDYLYLILSFVHFTNIGSAVSLSKRMAKLSNLLIKLLCRYDIARFSDAAIALALISIELEVCVCVPNKWTSITRKLQLSTKVSTDELMSCREQLLRHLSPSHIKLVFATISPDMLQQRQLYDVTTEQTDLKQATLQSGSSVAVKRKASAPSLKKQKARSKKPHPEISSAAAADMLSQNALLPPLESITEECQSSKCDELSPRRLTYAEIVKYGQDKAFGKLSEHPSFNYSEVMSCCSFEATLESSSSSEMQRRIKI